MRPKEINRTILPRKTYNTDNFVILIDAYDSKFTGTFSGTYTLKATHLSSGDVEFFTKLVPNTSTITYNFDHTGNYILEFTKTITGFAISSTNDSNLKLLKVLNIGTATWTVNFNSMFSNCINFTNINSATNFNLASNVSTFNSMFVNCTNLKLVDFRNVDFTNATNLRSLIANSGIETLIITHDLSNVTQIQNMLQNSALKSIVGFENWNLGTVNQNSSWNAGINMKRIITPYQLGRFLLNLDSNPTLPPGISWNFTGVKYKDSIFSPSDVSNAISSIAIKGQTVTTAGAL